MPASSRGAHFVGGTYRAKLRAEVASGVVGGVITARTIGSLPAVASAHVATATPIAGDFKVAALEQVLYHDSPRIRLAVMLADPVTFTVDTQPATVHVEIYRTVTTELIQKFRIPCPGRAKICTAVLDVVDVFKTDVTHSQISVRCRLGAIFEAPPLNVFAIHGPKALPATVTDTVWAEIPSRSLIPGETFDVEFRSRFRVFLKTVEFQVSCGGALEIVYSDGFPAIAADDSGSSVFETHKADGDPQRVYTAIAGRTDGRGAEQAGAPTDELLLTIQFRVTEGAVVGELGQIEITVLQGVTDLTESALTPATTGVLVGRGQSIVVNGPGNVYFDEDTVAAIFGVPGGPTELLNTAVISGTRVAHSVTAVGVRKRGSIFEVDNISCTSKMTNVMKVLSTNGNCEAFLDGTELNGSPQVRLIVQAAGLSDDVSYRVHFPITLRLEASKTVLRPIAGFYSDFKSDCSTLSYQPAAITASADFSDGSDDSFVNYDVSDIARVASLEPAILAVEKVGDRYALVGRSPGIADLRADLGTTVVTHIAPTIEVTGQSIDEQLLVVGIDAVVLSAAGLATVLLNQPHARGTQVDVEVEFLPPTLKFKGDSAVVVASAVLDDDSRVPLSLESGLVVSSLNSSILEVLDTTIHVPSHPIAFRGPLLSVAWMPITYCNNVSRNLSTGIKGATVTNVTVSLQSPVPVALLLSSSAHVLVCETDPAAQLGADFSSVAKLALTVRYTDGTEQTNMSSDLRVSYSTKAGASLLVSQHGTVLVDCDVGTIGTVVVTAHFKDSNVTGSIEIEVARAAEFRLSAHPWPLYAGFLNDSGTELGIIACSDPPLLQQAIIRSVLVLSNGREEVIESAAAVIEESSSIPGNIIADVDVLAATHIVRPIAPGSIVVVKEFYGLVSNELAINARDDIVVTVSSLVDFALTSTSTGQPVSTLSGAVGDTVAQATLGLILSDGRKIPNVFLDDGTPTVPGLLVFKSYPHGSGLSINSKSGLVSLVGNYPMHINVSVTTCATHGEAFKSINATANLQPTEVGDIDLGSITGPPVGEIEAGNSFAMEVRINTGGRAISYFNVKVHFNLDDLEVLKVENAISDDKASGVKFSYGLSAHSGEITAVATIFDSQVFGGSLGVHIFTVWFTAVKVGRTFIFATVTQLLDSSLGQPEQIGSENSEAIAGNVSAIVTGRNRKRRARAFGSSPRKSKRRSGDCKLCSQGDTNCDGIFDGRDLLLLLDFIVTRGNSFSTELGQAVLDTVGNCRRKRQLNETNTNFLDANRDTFVDLLDLVYLLDVMAGNYFLFNVASLSFDQQCSLDVTFELSSGTGDPPPNGFHLLLDIAWSLRVAEENSVRANGLVQFPGLITTEKGDVNLQGALVEASSVSVDEGLFSARFSSLDLHTFKDVGLSMIQVGGSEWSGATPRWKMFKGSPTSQTPPMYTGSLHFEATDLRSEIPLSIPYGYSPLLGDITTAAPPRCSEVVSSTTSKSIATSLTSYGGSDFASGDGESSGKYDSSKSQHRPRTVSPTKTFRSVSDSSVTVDTNAPVAVNTTDDQGRGSEDAQSNLLLILLIALGAAMVICNIIGIWYLCKQKKKRKQAERTSEVTQEELQKEKKEKEFTGIHGNLVTLALQNPAYDSELASDTDLELFATRPGRNDGGKSKVFLQLEPDDSGPSIHETDMDDHRNVDTPGIDLDSLSTPGEHRLSQQEKTGYLFMSANERSSLTDKDRDTDSYVLHDRNEYTSRRGTIREDSHNLASSNEKRLNPILDNTIGGDYSPQNRGDTEYLDVNANKDDDDEYLDVTGSRSTHPTDTNRAHIRMVDFSQRDGMDLDYAQSYNGDDTRSQSVSLSGEMDLEGTAYDAEKVFRNGQSIPLRSPGISASRGQINRQIDSHNSLSFGQKTDASEVRTNASEPLPNLTGIDLDDAGSFVDKILDEPNGRSINGQGEGASAANFELDALDRANLDSLDIIINALDSQML